MHGRESAAAVELGRDRGLGGLAGFAVAAFAARAGFGGHDLDGLEEGPGQPVQLREDDSGVARWDESRHHASCKTSRQARHGGCRSQQPGSMTPR